MRSRLDKRGRWVLLALLAGAVLGAPALEAQQSPRPVAGDTVAADTGGVSARGALLRSLVLPGWGQAYVGAPGRGAVYFAMEAGSLWMVFKARRQLAGATEQQALLRARGEQPLTTTTALVEARGQQVEDWITLAVFLLAFSGADAYVAAQLSDFGDNVGVLPAAGGGLQLRARVPLGGGR